MLKSLYGDHTHIDQEELAKAMNKAGLVQKEVQVKVKNGQTFMRKQWVKAGEDLILYMQSNLIDTPKMVYRSTKIPLRFLFVSLRFQIFRFLPCLTFQYNILIPSFYFSPFGC